MNYHQIVQAFREPIVRLKPSTINNAGVGVFAVTFIPKDTLIFKPQRNYLIRWEEIPIEALPYFKSICNIQDNGILIDCEPNKISAAYFVNHSHNPNLLHNLETDEFWAVRDISVDEELTCYYLPSERNWNVSKP